MSVSSDVEQRAFGRIARRFVPILTAAYVLNYLDRTNLSFAALQMNREIGLTDAQFGVGAGIFFIGYSLFEVPSNIALYRVGARRWMARIMVSWGLASALTAFVTGPNTFYAARFLLGLMEAGFFPGITFFLAMWFPPAYRAKMLAWFLVAIPLSSVVGGPVSTQLLRLDGWLGLAGWQWMFVIEAVPTVLVGVALWFVLSDRPTDANWLTEEERAAVLARIAADRPDRPEASLWRALRDPRVLVLAGVQFGFTLGSYAVGIWLPQLLKAQQFSTGAIGWLSAVPYVIASVAMILWAAVVDRRGRRIDNLTAANALAVIGLVLAVVSDNFVVSFLGITLAVVGVTSARAIFWSVPASFLTGLAAAGGLAFINSIGTVGGFVGPSVMGALRQETGSFSAGLLATSGFLVAATVMSACLRLLVRQERGSDHLGKALAQKR